MIMNGKYSLDTNTVISFMREDKKTVEAINELEEVFIPVTVVGELCYGAFWYPGLAPNPFVSLN